MDPGMFVLPKRLVDLRHEIPGLRWRPTYTGEALNPEATFSTPHKPREGIAALRVNEGVPFAGSPRERRRSGAPGELPHLLLCCSISRDGFSYAWAELVARTTTKLWRRKTMHVADIQYRRLHNGYFSRQSGRLTYSS